MAFTIWINGIPYTVGDHAASRMIKRFISEEMVIDTVEMGSFTEQADGTHLYEKEFFSVEDGVIIIRVAVDNLDHKIVTVIDVSDQTR